MAERPRDACTDKYTVFASFYVEGIAGGNVSVGDFKGMGQFECKFQTEGDVVH